MCSNSGTGHCAAVGTQLPNTMNTCKACGKRTTNPRFCDRSCAATFNNRRKPKRTPEGQCCGCGAVIPSRQGVCSACKEAQARAERDRAEGFFTICRLDGSAERVKTTPTSLVTRTVVAPIHTREFSGADRAAEVFKILLGILAVGPTWLRPEERARYAALFHDLAGFPVRTCDRSPLAETLPISDLPRAAHQWLGSLSRSDDPTR